MKTENIKNTISTIRPVKQFSSLKKRVVRRFVAVIAITCILAAAVPAWADMLLSMQYPGHVLRYDEHTGAYLGDIVATNSGGFGVAAAGLAFGQDANLYVADIYNNCVRRYNGQTGAFLDIFATNTMNVMNGLTGLAVGPDGNIYVNSQKPSVAVFDGQTGALLRHFGESVLKNPYGMRFDKNGVLYIVDRGVGIVPFNATNGASLGVFIPASAFSAVESGAQALDIAFGPDGNIYATDGLTKVLRFNGTTGAYLSNFVSGASNGLRAAAGLAFGPDGKLYVVSNHYGATDGVEGVMRFDGTTGAFIDVFATNGLNGGWGPQFVVFTPPLKVNIRFPEIEISWNSVSNATYRVDYCSSLTANTWTPLVNCVQAVGTTSSVLDRIAAGEPQRFYRVAVPNCVPSP